LKRKEFDPLAYIENAFLDSKSSAKVPQKNAESLDVSVPQVSDYIGGSSGDTGKKRRNSNISIEDSPRKFRKTEMRAPRPRRVRTKASETMTIDPTIHAVWESLPRNIEFLMGHFDDTATGNYYRGEFKESREDLIRRLLDPELSLEETARLLGVVPATVRRYTNRNWLNHHRTKGGQRRFRLSDVVRFVEIHGRFPQE
jgi:excisionase family DNA binding protein